MYAFQGCGRPSGLGSYALPWDAPSITGQLQVMASGELRFSVPGHNFNLQYAADPGSRAAFELYSFGGPVTVYGAAAGYGIYVVETWEAGAPAEPPELPPEEPTTPGECPSGYVWDAALQKCLFQSNHEAPPGNGGAPGDGGAPGAGIPAAAPIPWTPILALGALLLLPTLRRAR